MDGDQSANTGQGGAQSTGGGVSTTQKVAPKKFINNVTVDKTMTEAQYIEAAEAHYIIPKLVRQQYTDLLKLAYETESMNEEEREYWLQILPIMTEDQIIKFREILVNEHEQLVKIDADYKKEVSRFKKPQVREIDEGQLKAKLEKIEEAENQDEAGEKESEEKLLDQLENL